jgi:hypothetical protein
VVVGRRQAAVSDVDFVMRELIPITF